MEEGEASRGSVRASDTIRNRATRPLVAGCRLSLCVSGSAGAGAGDADGSYTWVARMSGSRKSSGDRAEYADGHRPLYCGVPGGGTEARSV